MVLILLKLTSIRLSVDARVGIMAESFELLLTHSFTAFMSWRNKQHNTDTEKIGLSDKKKT
jgi:hypothetical protein